MRSSIRAFAGQHGSAIHNIVASGIEVPLVGSNPQYSNPTGAPVVVEVGAVVNRVGQGVQLHVPFCSSVVTNPRLVAPGTHGFVGAAKQVGFDNRLLPFFANPREGDAGIIRFFGHVIRGADDQELFFRVRAAAFLKVDQDIVDAGVYEGKGGTAYGLREYARDNWRNLQASGIQIDDIGNVASFADRLFKGRGKLLLSPNDEYAEDRDLVAAGVQDWLPGGSA